MSSNLAPGVSESHPYFNPPTCPECGEVVEPGEDCPDCGKYVPTEDDLLDQKADQDYDRLHDEGRL
jgi:predicted amidophosphoribosyltransferase